MVQGDLLLLIKTLLLAAVLYVVFVIILLSALSGPLSMLMTAFVFGGGWLVFAWPHFTEVYNRLF